MQIRQVDPTSRRDVRRFVRFPFDLYRDSPQWVPPLLSDAESVFDPKRCPFYESGDAVFFIAEEDGRVVGRVGVLNNRRCNAYTGTHAAFFTQFDAVDDVAVSNALFRAAFDWACAQGLERISGPNSMNGAEASGILVEGFEHRPALGVPYNYPYYERLVLAAGFLQMRESLQGYLSAEQRLPERLIALAEQVKKRRGFTIKSFASKQEMREWIPRVLPLHAAFAGGEGYCPITEREARAFADTLLAVADPRLIKLIMKDDEVVGFIFAYPDVSEGLQRARGHLWPFGWWHLLRAQRNTEWCNVNGLALLPAYQGLGANAVLYAEIDKTLRDAGFKHADVVMVGAENFRSRSDMETMGVRWYKRHRSYWRDLPGAPAGRAPT